jgi:hypothetical protein
MRLAAAHAGRNELTFISKVAPKLRLPKPLQQAGGSLPEQSDVAADRIERKAPLEVTQRIVACRRQGLRRLAQFTGGFDVRKAERRDMNGIDNWAGLLVKLS